MKYNIENTKDLFKMFLMTNELGEKGRGELVSQYIGKIAEFRYPD